MLAVAIFFTSHFFIIINLFLDSIIILDLYINNTMKCHFLSLQGFIQIKLLMS